MKEECKKKREREREIEERGEIEEREVMSLETVFQQVSR